MQLTYWGTAAAEGVPALFCQCETCRYARREQGRNCRGRAQALIDGELMIDFGADLFQNSLRYGKDMTEVKYVLITHGHDDHLYTENFGYTLDPSFAHGEFFLDVYGLAPNMDLVRGLPYMKERAEKMALHLAVHDIEPFVPFTVGKYRVTAYPANHGANPVIYGIEADGKSLLYLHDSGLLSEEVFAYWKANGVRFDFVSIDCTFAARDKQTPTSGHQGLYGNILTREAMRACGAADDGTVFCCNHFSHNGVNANYDEFVSIAEKEGFLVSYDGMTVTL